MCLNKLNFSLISALPELYVKTEVGIKTFLYLEYDYVVLDMYIGKYG